VTVELTGPEHEERLINTLIASGYNVEVSTGSDDHARLAPGFGGYREKTD
jgi:hypothetical protein